MIETQELENILYCYTLEEILELNDLTEFDVLWYLCKHNLITLPEPRPL